MVVGKIKAQCACAPNVHVDVPSVATRMHGDYPNPNVMEHNQATLIFSCFIPHQEGILYPALDNKNTHLVCM